MTRTLEAVEEAREDAHNIARERDAAAATLKRHAENGATNFVAKQMIRNVEPAEAEILGLGDEVVLSKSREAGQIVGVAVYDRAPRQYLVEYVAADGRQVESWLYRNSLRLA